MFDGSGLKQTPEQKQEQKLFDAKVTYFFFGMLLVLIVVTFSS